LNLKQRFEVDSMIDEHTTNEYFKERLYCKIVPNSKYRFGVDTLIDEHTTNEYFKEPLY